MRYAATEVINATDGEVVIQLDNDVMGLTGDTRKLTTRKKDFKFISASGPCTARLRFDFEGKIVEVRISERR